MIRLIAADLDGTLLYPDGQLPEGVFQVIRALKEKGVFFAAASGRQYSNLRRLFSPVADEIDYIAENGAFVKAGGSEKALWFDPAMARDIMRDILNAGMELLVSAPETSYLLSSGDKEYLDHMVYRLRNTCTVIDDPDSVADTCIKISGFASSGVENLAPPLQAKWQGRVHCDIAGRDWLDFTLSNKGGGIRTLCQSRGIALADAAAFGDQFNDDSMLSIVGHPYIMAHAPEGLLKKGYTPCQAVLPKLKELLAACPAAL